MSLCLLHLLGTVVTLGIAWQLSRVVNLVFLQDASCYAAATDLGLLLFLLLLKALLKYPFSRQLNSISATLQLKIRKKLHYALIDQAIDSDKMQLLGIESVGALDKLCTVILPQALSFIILMPLILVVIAFMDWWSALIMFITLPIAPILLALVGKKTKAATIVQWQELGNLTAAFKDMLAGIISLKIFRQESKQGMRLSQLSHQFTDATMKVLRLAFVSSFTIELITTLTIAILAVSIGLGLLYGTMNFQTAFFMLLLLPEFYLPLRQSGMAFHAVMDVKTAWSNIQEVIGKQPVEVSGHQEPVRIPPGIQLSKVSFSYPGAPLPTLQDVSMAFPAMSTTCVYGTSGIGKTTLLRVMAGLLEPQSGNVMLEDKPLRDISRESRHKLITYIPQIPRVFQGTLAENICLFAGEEVDASRIKRAIMGAGLAMKPDTCLGAGGQGLSNGQVHRLGLARAIYQDRPLVLMDEPTAGLEPAEEQEILKVLDDFSRRRTMIIISHHNAVRSWAAHAVDLEDNLAASMQEVPYE